MKLGAWSGFSLLFLSLLGGYKGAIQLGFSPALIPDMGRSISADAFSKEGFSLLLSCVNRFSPTPCCWPPSLPVACGSELHPQANESPVMETLGPKSPPAPVCLGVEAEVRRCWSQGLGIPPFSRWEQSALRWVTFPFDHPTHQPSSPCSSYHAWPINWHLCPRTGSLMLLWFCTPGSAQGMHLQNPRDQSWSGCSLGVWVCGRSPLSLLFMPRV